MDDDIKTKSYRGHKTDVQMYFVEMLDLLEMIKYEREEELRLEMEKIIRRNSDEL